VGNRPQSAAQYSPSSGESPRESLLATQAKDWVGQDRIKPVLQSNDSSKGD
jgi:hypothetical protein